MTTSENEDNLSKADMISLRIKERNAEKRGRGRPSNAEKYKEELARRELERQQFLDKHPLVLANPAPSEFSSAASRLVLVKSQMAKEAASLEFNKLFLDLEGKDTSMLSSRIVGTLQKMSEIDLDIKKMGAAVVDPRSEEVQKMVAIWIHTLSETLTQMVKDKVLDTQTMDLIFNKFSTALEGWEDRITSS